MKGLVMKREEIVKVLIESAENHGVVETLYAVFGKRVSMSIPYSNKACDTNIDNLDFSPRAEHSLKRAGIFTLGEVIDCISNEHISKIRNLGKKTENEIKTKIMVYGYSQLTANEKARFFYDVLDKNAI